MTVDGFSILATVLEMLPPQFDQRWDADARAFYFNMLEDIPDDDAMVVAKAIGKKHTKRPVPSVVLDIWREVTRPPSMSADMAVTEIYRAINEPQYREGVSQMYRWVSDNTGTVWERHGAAHARAVVGRYNRGDKRPAKRKRLSHRVYYTEKSQVRIFTLPAWLAADTTLNGIVDAMGGWESVKWGPSSENPSIFRGQLRRMAEMVIDNAPDETITQLRLEHKAQRQNLLEQQWGGDDDGETRLQLVG